MAKRPRKRDSGGSRPEDGSSSDTTSSDELGESHLSDPSEGESDDFETTVASESGEELADGEGADAMRLDGQSVDDDQEPTDDELDAPDDEPTIAPTGGSALSLRDPFQAYLREVQRYPLLTSEQERELTTKYVETGDPAIARRLVTANLRLVIKLAYEYRRAYKNMMDLIQEGNIGLMQAVQRFDPYRGVKLSSYSAWWIRAYMLRFILNNWRLVKLGTTQAQRKLFFNLNKQKAKLTALGIEPTADEIAGRLGVKVSEVQEMDRRLGSGEASLDAPLGDSEGRSIPRIEMMASDDRGADETVARNQLNAMLNERLARFRATLTGKDLTIFDERLVAEEPLTLQKLGDDFGVSRERVRQLEARLAGKLRDYLKSELGDAVELGV